MELVFVHGWGFEASFWDPLAAFLTDYPQQRVDRGYFGSKRDLVKTNQKSVLIGHSLGFVHGLSLRQDWAGLIAINSFARFIREENKMGCVAPSVLRDMRMRLVADPAKTLGDFYGLIGAKPPAGTPDTARLREGLDELRDTDCGASLAALDVPTLILASRDDELVPVKASEALAREAMQGRLEWHSTGNHTLPQSDPDWCALHIKRFLLSFK